MLVTQPTSRFAHNRALKAWIFQLSRQTLVLLLVWSLALTNSAGDLALGHTLNALGNGSGPSRASSESFPNGAPQPSGPIIYSISPDNVPAGQTVSISGANLGSTPGTVTVAGASAHVVSWGAYSISFQVPGAIATGADLVAVTTSSGQTVSTTLHVVFAPVITSITPSVGVPYTQVTVAGSGFGTVSGGSVTFTGVAGQILSWSDHQIVVKAPDGGAGRGPVVVTWQGVNSNGVTFNRRMNRYVAASNKTAAGMRMAKPARIGSTPQPAIRATG